jgi:MHS family citrate/tricarballylate:H+ symporter-like MFS transporter
MMVTELWLSVLYASYDGAAVVALTEVMPPHVRTVGFSLATSIFGGFTPQVTVDHAAPGWWMSGAAARGLCATFLLCRGIAEER